jgi:hypothetical protein
MSKLAHSNQETMDEIERNALQAEERGERTEPPPEPTTVASMVERIRKELLEGHLDGEWYDGVTAACFRITEALYANREELVLTGVKSLVAQYPRDLAFANAGFTLGVARAVVDGVLPAIKPRVGTLAG